MKCIIIEDQPPAQRILKKYLADLGTLELVGTFSEATQSMEFLQNHQVDLIFLDIHLPKISGMDFLRILPNSPAVILTTAFPDYALESYELNVVDYLLKPFSFQRFVQAVSKVTQKDQPVAEKPPEQPKPQTPQEVFVKSGYEHIKVTIADILYIKSDADYTELLVGGKKLLSSESLRFWVDFLDEQHFIRIHKSFIVNTAKITKVSGNQVYLENGEALPIGRAYKEHFAERFLS